MFTCKTSKLSLSTALLALGLMLGGCAADATNETKTDETTEAQVVDEAVANEAVEPQDFSVANANVRSTPNVLSGDAAMLVTEEQADSTANVFGGWGGFGWGGVPVGIGWGGGWGGGLGWGGLGWGGGWGGGFSSTSVAYGSSVGWGGLGWGGGLGCAGLCGIW